jgi:type II pantothenate kinase
MAGTFLAVDLGMTNIDLVMADETGTRNWMFSNQGRDVIRQLEGILGELELSPHSEVQVGVTGGQYRSLPDHVAGYRVQKVDEMCAVGWGGLSLAGVDRGLVVSAGTGTAMVHATRASCQHVTGSAVGGGTLLGLCRLILGTADVAEIDRLAMAGDAAGVDVMLREAVGGEIGKLPAEANAVNLGKLACGMDPTREDLAAGLVRLVAQVISVIAINAARAEGLQKTILIGHLMDLTSIRREVALVGRFYEWTFTIPEKPGSGTAMGVLAALKGGDGWQLGFTDRRL